MDNIRLLIVYRLLHGKDRTEADRLRLETWLQSSEANRQLYNRLMNREHWSEWRRKRETVRTDDYWKKVEASTIKRKTQAIRRRLWGVAAAVILLFSVAGILMFRSETTEEPVQMASAILPGVPQAKLVFADGESVYLDSRQTLPRHIEKDGTVIVTDSAGICYAAEGKESESEARHTLLVPRGGEYILTLEDGTVVHLNAQSILEFPAHFTGDTREVYLEGEAYFQVKQAEEKPFVVHTRSMDILVTGTTFNVRAYHDEAKVQTTLVEGRVNVRAGEAVNRLSPGQQAELDLASMATTVREVDTDYYTAWRNGWFVFKGERLEDIMTELARWYDFNVFYQNPEVRDMIFGGKLNREGAIEPILKIMEATLTLNISIKGKTVVFQSN